ncbi:MAG: tetratricopeptide repeat protein [Syntrophobacterales bacterium]|nr:MAG: tetratricopeptide repeat protein [Syntrophobacterales bacterium]
MVLLRIYRTVGKIILLILAVLIILAACAGMQNKKSATSYFEEGAVLVKQGKYDLAIKRYKKGLRIEPRSAVGYNYLGIAYRYKYDQLRSLDWKRREIEAFKKAIKLDPNFYLPYINLGTTYYVMENLKESAIYLKKGLEIFPEHPSRELIEQMIQEGEREVR